VQRDGSLITRRFLLISRRVYSDPLTAGLKPASNGETSAPRGMTNEVSVIRCFGNFDYPGLQTASAPLASNTTKARNLASISVAEVVE
jgi:hypothetical protein